MTEVSVDLDDLKALVYATGAVKAIEQTIIQARRDPFSAPYMTMSHGRIAQAILHAERSARSGETATGWDDPLSDGEVDLLMKCGDERMPFERFTRANRASMPIDSLASKGMIIIGQCVHAVIWAGASTVSDVIADGVWFAVKVTPRGEKKLRELKGTQ